MRTLRFFSEVVQISETAQENQNLFIAILKHWACMIYESFARKCNNKINDLNFLIRQFAKRVPHFEEDLVSSKHKFQSAVNEMQAKFIDFSVSKSFNAMILE